jgi:hypothetical protein
MIDRLNKYCLYVNQIRLVFSFPIFDGISGSIYIILVLTLLGAYLSGVTILYNASEKLPAKQ